MLSNIYYTKNYRMETTITYFVHGTTTDNEKEISSGRYDVELSPLWIKQSIDLKNLITDKKFDVVFCSDLKRAVESAKLTFEWEVPIIVDDRLRECNYGDFNANPSSVVEPMQPEHIYESFPNGESYEDVKERMMSLIDDIEKDYAWKSIAFVAHKAPQLVLDVIIKGKSREEAFAEDWRHTKAWKPWREYVLSDD